MARKPRPHVWKSNQTNPSVAGPQNISKEMKRRMKDDTEDNLMRSLIGVFDKGAVNQKRLRTANWTPEEMLMEIRDYFKYCDEHALKPNKSSIQAWLGCSRQTYSRWTKETERFGELSDVIRLANNIMADQYVNRGEKYPTMNIFLLKSAHGYKDQQEVLITNTDEVKSEDVDELVKKLGLHKVE